MSGVKISSSLTLSSLTSDDATFRFVLKLNVNTPSSSAWGRMRKHPGGASLNRSVAWDRLHSTKNSHPSLSSTLSILDTSISFKLDHTWCPASSSTVQSESFEIIASIQSYSRFQLAVSMPSLTAIAHSLIASLDNINPPPRWIHKHVSSCQLMRAASRREKSEDIYPIVPWVRAASSYSIEKLLQFCINLEADSLIMSSARSSLRINVTRITEKTILWQCE